MLLAGVAVILLFLGLAQALETRPGRSASRTPPRSSRGSRPDVRTAAPERIPPPEVQRAEPTTGPKSRAWRRPGAGAGPVAPIPLPAEARSNRADLSRAPETPVPQAALALPSVADPALDALEGAWALQHDGQHARVIESAMPHLEGGGPDGGAGPSFVRAALWAAVGVSRHALGDVEGAGSALEAAMGAAPVGSSEGLPQRLAAGAVSSARALLEAADTMSAGSLPRVAVLRMAARWLEWRLVTAPATEEVPGLLDGAREALWDAYALAARGLIRGRQFTQARELVRQALESEDLPEPRRAPLAELSAVSVAREIGRLVAVARGTETPAAGALDALERARGILDANSTEADTPGRVPAANRRIWNGYMRLGRRAIEAFELEAALPPLFRALHLRELDPGLERATHALLARTIERISDRAGETVGRLLEEGDHAAASQRCQDVRGMIQKARDEGLSHEELTPALGRVRQMLELIAAAKP